MRAPERESARRARVCGVAARAAQREVCQRAAIDVNLAAKSMSALDFEKQGEML